jgi:hypothetical protein
MPWPKSPTYVSKRFKNFNDVEIYFKDVPEQSAIVDAILFLASQIVWTDENLRELSDEIRGYDP